MYRFSHGNTCLVSQLKVSVLLASTKMYCYVFYLYFARFTTALDVYQSSLSLTESQNQLSGLYFQNTENRMYSNSLTVCIRLNYKRLGLGNEARFFAFGTL